MTITPAGHALGYVPDAPDERDHLYTTTQSLHQFVDLSNSPCMPPIWDQGQLGSCTAHGTLAAFLFAAAKARKANEVALPMLSRLQVYWNSRALEGTTDQDAGAQVRDAIKACAEGVAPEVDWPYDIYKFAVQPTGKAQADATNKAIEYQAVARHAPGIQACLAEGFPVVIGVTLYSSFESSKALSTGVVPHPRPFESQLGGHCMLVTGIGFGNEWVKAGFPEADLNTRYVKVRNSWGTDVYKGGYLLLPVSYLHRHGQDFWTIRSAN